MKTARAPVVVAAGLIVAALAASASASIPTPTRTVVLTVHHSRFTPSTIEAKPGETIRFVVRNNDPIDHELIVGPMSVQARHESGHEKWHPPRPGEVSVPLFGVASTTYTFDEPGKVWFGCHLPGHWAYGMKGQVSVG